MRPTVALVRGVPDSLGACELTHLERRPIDVEEARRCHAAYRAMLEDAGLRVLRLDADEAHPDCPFVEDCALEIDGLRILCSPGAPSRRGELPAVRRALEALGPVRALPPELRLDGGDVLQVGGRVLVGRSARTDPGAIAWLRERVDREVVEVPVRGALHLKTAATAIDDGRLLAVPGALNAAALPSDLRVVPVAPGEEAAANLLPLPDGSLAMAAGFPRTEARLRALHPHVRALPIEPFARAEAGLTCLSVLLAV